MQTRKSDIYLYRVDGWQIKISIPSYFIFPCERASKIMQNGRKTFGDMWGGGFEIKLIIFLNFRFS